MNRGKTTLHPQGVRRKTLRQRIRSDMHLKQRKAFYASFKPAKSHRYDVSPFPSHFDLFGQPGQFAPNLKILAILFLVLSGSIGGYFWYAQPGNGLFHSYLPNPDPQQLLWDATSPNTDTSEFHVVNVVEATLTVNGYNSKAIKLTPTATQAAAALSLNPIDISTVNGKNLLAGFGWAIPSASGSTNIRYGMFLRMNGTIPSELGYSPFNDKQVVMILEHHTSGVGLVFTSLWMQRDPTISLANGEPGNCPGSGTCFFSGQFSTANIHPDINLIQDQASLNFTGTSSGALACTGTTGNACSSYLVNDFQSTNQIVLQSTRQPWLATTQSYYVGFFAEANLGASVYFTFDLSNGSMSLWRSVIPPGNCTASVPCPAPPPTLDTGGWFGPVIKALISIGVFIAQNLINFLAYLGGLLWGVLTGAFSALWGILVGLGSSLAGVFSALLNDFESIVKNTLNVVGTSFGFPASASCNFVSNPGGCGLGDDLFQEITYLISTVTTTIATFIGGLTNIFLAILDFFGAITTWFTTWGTYFVNAIVAIANLVGEIITVIKQVVLLAPSSFTWGAIVFFIIYSSLDGLDGWFEFFESAAWVLLFGISVAEKILNWLISTAVWIISLLPSFQASGEIAAEGAGFGGGPGGKFDLPRLPLLEHNFSLHFPHNFTDPELKNGNLFSVIGLAAGCFMLIYAVGANLVPGLNATNGVNLNLINALLPVGLVLIGIFGVIMLPFLLAYLFRNIFGIGVTTPSLAFQVSREKIPLRTGKVKGPGFKVGLRPSKHKFQVRAEDGRKRTVTGIRNIIREGKRQASASQERLRRETERLREQQLQQQRQREREAQHRAEQSQQREQRRRELGRSPEGFE